MKRLAHTLVGPYARQVTPWKLKFWFVLINDEFFHHKRYSLEFDGRSARMWRRDESVAAFRKHAVPEDLSTFPAITYPRHKGDRLEDAAMSMLVGDDVADVLRLRLTGILPQSQPGGGDLPLLANDSSSLDNSPSSPSSNA